jgi:hypothetical protein
LTLGIAPRRAKRRWLVLLCIVAIAGIVAPAANVFAGTIGNGAGFEDDDANLTPASLVDWNSFDDPVGLGGWDGTSPTRTRNETVSGFKFLGLEDWQATTADSGFAGGTKQDEDCPAVITQKADNKADLKRIYVASKTLANGHTYLALAWVRIPQNTTSPSAHIAFEFNQGNAGACGGASDGLVKRSTTNGGDVLVLYDFEGGQTDNPTIRLSRWVGSGACEIANDAPPCWSPAVDLTAAGIAEAKVNTLSSASDTVAPANETLGINEFGEAGIDLTDAGVFPIGTCNTLGKVYGVSRTSGNSGTAQMKDLVGPGDFNLTNCGQIKVIKHTNPRGLNKDFAFTSTIPSTSTCVQDATPAGFSLNDNGNTSSDSTGNTEDCTNVPAGTYTVTEGADPAGFAFASYSCTATGTGTSYTAGASARQVSITIAGGGVVVCTYTNNQQLGAIKITKTSSKGTNPGLPGATFSVTKGGVAISGSPFTTDANGVACIANLTFGDYVVTETGAPTGYSIDDATGHTVTVDNNANCTDASYVGESIGFTDTPLSDIQVRFRDGGSGATSLVSAISCTNLNGGTSSTTDTTGWDDTLTVTGIKAPTTIVCTIDIDP